MRLERLTGGSDHESDTSSEEDAAVGGLQPVASVLVKSIAKGLEDMELSLVRFLKECLKEGKNVAVHYKQALEAAEENLKIMNLELSMP